MIMTFKLTVKNSYGLLINNEWVPASDGVTFEAHNPANGALVGTCAEATKADVDRAVEVATEAFKTWKHTDKVYRAELLLKIADAIGNQFEKLWLWMFLMQRTTSATSLAFSGPKKGLRICSITRPWLLSSMNQLV